METRNYVLEHGVDSFPLMLKILFFQIFTTDHITNFDSTPEHIFSVLHDDSPKNSQLETCTIKKLQIRTQQF